MRLRYPPEKRIRQASDFRSISQQGKRVRASDIDARYLASPVGYVRVGIVAPLHGQGAVARNRLKRRLRELARRLLLPVEQSVDIVLWCRPAAYRCSFEELKRRVEGVAEHIRETGAREEPG